MISDDMQDKSYRTAFVDAVLKHGIAFQLRALRNRAGLTQQQLGELAGKSQNVISRLEDPDYGKFTLQTLLSLASAFDVALLVKFVSFEDLARNLKDVSEETLAVDSYEQQTKKLRNREERYFTSASKSVTQSNVYEIADYVRAPVASGAASQWVQGTQQNPTERSGARNAS